MSEGFFSRWARRKQEVSAGRPPPPEPVAAVPAQPRVETGAPPAAPPLQQSNTDAPASADRATDPLPTLEDVQALTPESDFQPFMQRGVGAQVRNAAMKKLFADPHFNVMDGLDTYIDDYSQPDPLPVGMLRRMASAQFLRLAPGGSPEDEPGRPQDPDADQGRAALPEVVAQCPDPLVNAEPAPHDDPDLQLQPEPASAAQKPGQRTG